MQVFFDYTCPFAYQAHRWLENAGAASEARWRMFSLLEKNYRGDGPPVWTLDERRDDISLLLFAGHKLVEARGGDLQAYRRDVFHTWHETDDALDLSDVVTFATRAGVDATEADLRAVFTDAMGDHDEARRLGVFGSPTLVFSADHSVFVKLAGPPEGDDAHALLDEMRTFAGRRHLLEAKRPQPSRSERKGATRLPLQET